MQTKNPYELGQEHAKAGKDSDNPFPQFSEKWALYNRGYNGIRFPWLGSNG